MATNIEVNFISFYIEWIINFFIVLFFINLEQDNENYNNFLIMFIIIL